MAYAGKPKVSLVSIALGKTKDKMGNPPPPEDGEEEPMEKGDSAGATMAAEDLIEAVQSGDAKGVIAALKACMEYC